MARSLWIKELGASCLKIGGELSGENCPRGRVVWIPHDNEVPEVSGTFLASETWDGGEFSARDVIMHVPSVRGDLWFIPFLGMGREGGGDSIVFEYLSETDSSLPV